MSTYFHKQPFLHVYLTRLPIYCVYLPREELQLHSAEYQKLFRTSAVLKDRRMSPIGTAKGNLHVQNIELKQPEQLDSSKHLQEVNSYQKLQVARSVFGHIEDLNFNGSSFVVTTYSRGSSRQNEC